MCKKELIDIDPIWEFENYYAYVTQLDANGYNWIVDVMSEDVFEGFVEINAAILEEGLESEVIHGR